MDSTKDLRTKEQLGRELARTRQIIKDLAKEWRRGDCAVLGLSVENALSNAGYNVLDPRSREAHGQNLRAAVMKHIITQIEITTMVIEAALIHGGAQPSRLGRVPEFEFGLLVDSEGRFEEQLDEMLSRHKVDLKRDFVDVRSTTLAMLSAPALRVLVAKGARISQEVGILRDWLRLREAVYKAALLDTALRLGYGVRISEADPPSYTPLLPENFDWDGALMQDLSHPSLVDSLMEPHKWGTDLPEAAAATLRSRDFGKGPLNRQLLRKEAEALVQGFEAFPSYPAAFRHKIGIELRCAFDLMESIAMRAYSRKNCVLSEAQEKTVLKVSQATGYDKRTVRQALRAMLLPSWGKANQLLLRISDENIVTSFDQVARFQSRLLNMVFSTEYDTNWRGALFEERCRKSLAASDFDVVKGRVLVREALVPAAISLKLWGVEKRKTDLDVVAARDDLLMILECKELKVDAKQVTSLHMANMFDRFREELYWKAKTLSSSPVMLERILTKRLLSTLRINPARTTVAPALVSNLPPRRYETGIPLVAFEELGELATALSDELTNIGQALQNPQKDVFVTLGKQKTPFVLFRVT